MKPKKAKDLRELPNEDLNQMLRESIETLTRLRLQHSLGQLQDTASLKIIKKDIARIKTILNERRKVSQ